MRRRRLLTSAGSTLGACIAGCLVGDQPDGAEQTNDRSPDETAPSTDTPSPGPPSTSAFDVVDSSCGSGGHVAAVTFEDETIRVDGTIEGNNACTSAALDDVRLEDDLVVAIETVPPDDEGCAQCIADIEYEAQFEFAGPLPATVRVEHDGQTVTRTQR